VAGLTGAGPERTVAAFDFDGTLTRHDTLIPFLNRLVGWPRISAALARDTGRLALFATGRGNRDAAKERLLVRLLEGWPITDVVRVGERYGAAVAEHGIRPRMRQQLQWHRDNRHEIVIVSASLDVYLEPAARALGADGLLCTRLEVDEDGLCTGRMLGGNCRGPAKAERLREYLGDADVTLWAYGNSRADEPMLALAQFPVRVGRRRKRGRRRNR
jgi:phosphatidylglycerophosphatase C